MPTTNPASTKYAPPMASHPHITATGIKGFLQWMKTDKIMSQVYGQIKPQLNQLLNAEPAGLSGRVQKLQGLGCYCYCTGLGCCNNWGTCCFGGECGCAYTTDSTIAAAPTDSANSSSLANSISSMISKVGSMALNSSALSQVSSMTTAQLQRAAAGQSPLNMNTLFSPNSGTGLSSLSTTEWVLIGGAVLAVVMLAGKKS